MLKKDLNSHTKLPYQNKAIGPTDSKQSEDLAISLKSLFYCIADEIFFLQLWFWR